ncbi:MAG: imidazole glycerol phosphate synthase subunit HisH, partial [Monoglobaceae bacterium]
MISIIDYGAGNLRSVQKACEYNGATAVVTSDKDKIKSA